MKYVPKKKGDSIEVIKYLNFRKDLRTWKKRKELRNFKKNKSCLEKPQTRNEAAVPNKNKKSLSSKKKK